MFVLALALLVVELSLQVCGQGLTFSLRGQVVAVGSDVGITEIGEDSNALLCLTDLIDCCKTNRQGQWLFPDGSQVVIANNADGDIYRSRDTQQISLNRRNNATGPLGLYCCMVGTMADPNAVGCINITTISPRVPEEVNAVSTSTTITVSWSFTTLLDFTNEVFTVVYGTTPGALNVTSDKVQGMPTIQEYSLNIESLLPATTYHYQIRSTNSFESQTSDELIIRTMDARSTEVREVMLRAPDDTTLVLSWQTPIPSNGDILTYTVRVIGGTTRIVDNTTEFAFMASSLSAGVPYEVSIIPVNLAGQGEFSTTTYFTQELTPNVAVIVLAVERTSSTTMDVSWRPLTLSEARGFVTFYSIAYTPTPNSRKRQAPQDTMYLNASADSSSVTIQGLDGDLTYSVTVAANTIAGSGLEGRGMIVETFPTISPTVSNQESDTAILVGGVATAILVLAISTITTTVLVVLVVRGKKRKMRQKKDSTQEEELESNEVHIYNTIDEPDYEVVRCDTKDINKEEFVYNECPAYLPTGGSKVTKNIAKFNC